MIVNNINLTTMEIQFLNGMRNNNYRDILDGGGDWLFAVIDECPYTEKQATGVISSLTQKGLIETEYLRDERLHVVGYTKAGKALYDNADGEECVWGGQPLLRLE